RRYFKYFVNMVVVFIYFYYAFYYDRLPELIKKLGDRPFIFWIPYVLIGISLAHKPIRRLSSIYAVILLIIPLELLIFEYYNVDRSAYITLGVLLSSVIFCVTILQMDFKIKCVTGLKLINYISD